MKQALGLHKATKNCRIYLLTHFLNFAAAAAVSAAAAAAVAAAAAAATAAAAVN